MVATRGIEDAASFVLGNVGTIDPKTIRTEEWVEILRAAVEKLPINYLRGLKSIKQILTHERDIEVRCIVTEMPKLSRTMRPTDVFLDCAAGGDFAYIRPRGPGLQQQWDDAPRKPKEQGGKLSIPTERHILLSRQKKFHYLLVNWIPKEEWSAEYDESPIKFWYEAHLTTMQLLELDDQQLGDALKGEANDMPISMLRSFSIALRNTLEDLSGQRDRILAQKIAFNGYLERLGDSVA